jgi:hypothetical protein
MRVFKIGLVLALGVVGMPLLAACSSDASKQGSEQANVGSLSLKLTGVSTSGARYRLHNGSFTVSGPKAETLSTETDPESTSIRSELPAGNYLIKLKAGWTLDKEVMGTFTTVKSVLVSDNPAGFRIFDQGVTSVVFQFRAGDDVVQLGDGTLDVSIGVDDGPGCPMGTAQCNGVCVDVNSDPSNCGACGNQCMMPASCVAGSCQIACPPGTVNCGAGCVDTFNDPNNCGGCGLVCAAGTSCNMGMCGGGGCPGGLQQCGGACVDVTSDNNNCGSCGSVCSAGSFCKSSACQTPGQVLQFSGVANNIPVDALTGWSQCYVDTYDNFSTPIADILASCGGSQLLLGCRPVGSSTLQVAANAPRADVLFDCGQDRSCSRDSNGAAWYFSDNWSWGFARSGDAVDRFSCDVAPGDDSSRLCWHSGAGNINGGYRCGADTSLNGSTAFERVVFTAP